MILDYIKHSELDFREEVMVLLHYGRLMTIDTMGELLGLSPTAVVGRISKINKGGKFILGKRHKEKKYFFLGPKGCEVVSEILGEKSYYYDYAKSRGKHTDGITRILSRLVKELGIKTAKQEIYWRGTAKTRQLLETKWHKRLEGQHIPIDKIEEELNKLIEPDAHITFPGLNASYWLEFDNNTETSSQIKKKLLAYPKALFPIGDRSAVLWVTTDESRRKELEKCYQEVSSIDQLPNMYFYVAGQETQDLVSVIQSARESRTSSVS